MAEHRCAVWDQDASLSIESRETTLPGPDEVQVQVHSVGICGSDLHFFRGDFRAAEGLVPGHEISGTISAVGGKVRHVKEGDAVGIEPLLRCGTCASCLVGSYNVCADKGFIGIARDGGMAEYACVPGICAFKTPGDLAGELVTLAEPLACSVHAFNKASLRTGQTVFILGAGSIGLTGVVAAKAMGANVVLQARHPHQQELGRLLGADEVLGEDDASKQRVRELVRLRAVDVALETVGGAGSTLVQAQTVLRPKGKLVVLGTFTGAQAPIHALHLGQNEIEIVGSLAYCADGAKVDYRTAMEIIGDAREQIGAMVTHRFPLEQANAAFETALDKTSRSVKVLIQPVGAS